MKLLTSIKLAAILAVLVLTGCSKEETFVSQILGSYTVKDLCLINEMENQGEEYILTISQSSISADHVEISNFKNLGDNFIVKIEDEAFEWIETPINIGASEAELNGGGDFMVLPNLTTLNFVYEIGTDLNILENCITTGTRM